VFATFKYSQPCLTFTTKAEAYPSEAPFSGHSLGVESYLYTKIKIFADKHSSLLCSNCIGKEKNVQHLQLGPILQSFNSHK
jgi:hypothetical protein